MSRLWEKGLPLDERVLRYTAGEDHALDARLVAYDVRGSIAHAEMLAAQDLLGEDDCTAIVDGLNRLLEQHDAGEWQIRLEDEDVHTALESRLTDLIGEAGLRPYLATTGLLKQRWRGREDRKSAEWRWRRFSRPSWRRADTWSGKRAIVCW